MEVTQQHYETAASRLRTLMKVVDETTPAADPRLAEIDLLTAIVKDYERMNFPYGRPSVGDIIRQNLERNGMTQRQLAAEIGSSTSRINDFVSGKSCPSLTLAAKICLVLNIPPAVMMGI